ncbi:hypothetical protein IS481_00870 [Caldimonas thermodepolymerans]|jgi:hypothetical protein|uniref:Universal stress protein n=1 Tax=Caldimonas thermodepolymerans TaxID=215580 RepID=A0A2S5T4X2_9BURK|nr:hypothetical protein [Caldimonas thermodepolymerans]PPE70031.1 hypothetical protein C1702_09245 [Caldimonas thermodepolymerans]QPC31772.1 hypothetical protein IS481_00870 [Caldimonas thermodepolymerans]RDI01723.1 hypothetical protein DES46_103286 [Caldimonas thermodepolymerans]TCP05861.1 hypothetical protein EV676_10894 [Caldimonas thermodepolymerans]UZG44556.1 hypothetical protein ONZ46_01030 [Caldimonas thermodepolymerans]
MQTGRKIAVLLDDAAHAQSRLAAGLDDTRHAQWVLVACAPRMTHRASKWLSHGAREHWRRKWANRLFAQMQPWLAAHGIAAEVRLARGPLKDVLEELAVDEVIDVRRPKATVPGGDTPEVHWELPSLLAFGLGLWLSADA